VVEEAVAVEAEPVSGAAEVEAVEVEPVAAVAVVWVPESKNKQDCRKSVRRSLSQ
jgi:hypothetical protein